MFVEYIIVHEIYDVCGSKFSRLYLPSHALILISGMAAWYRQKRETNPTGCIYYKFECVDEACIEKAKNVLSSLACPPIDFHCKMGNTDKYACQGRSICVDNSGALPPNCPAIEEVYAPVGNCG